MDWMLESSALGEAMTLSVWNVSMAGGPHLPSAYTAYSPPRLDPLVRVLGSHRNGVPDMKTATKSAMKFAKAQQLDGDAMKPNSTDMLAQTIRLPTGEEPRGDGWRILTGNVNFNLWARVAFRYEIKDDLK